jgi:hypothetical protein
MTPKGLSPSISNLNTRNHSKIVDKLENNSIKNKTSMEKLENKMRSHLVEMNNSMENGQSSGNFAKMNELRKSMQENLNRVSELYTSMCKDLKIIEEMKVNMVKDLIIVD